MHDIEIKSLTFEGALAQLEEIVKKLESNQADLEQQILLYERGQALRRHCAEKLNQAQMRIQKITQEAQAQDE